MHLSFQNFPNCPRREGNLKTLVQLILNSTWPHVITYTNNASFCCWQRTTFLFVLRNEQRFKNLHGVIGNKERFSDKKFLNVMTYLQSEILIFLVFVSSSDLTLFSGDITKISGNMTKVSGDLTGYPSPLLL